VLRGELDRHTELAGLPLVYEVSRRRNAFWFDAGFAGQLEAWLAQLDGLGLGLRELWTYGAWTDGDGNGNSGCRSWHNAGRAFDVARVPERAGEISCRYDQWRALSGAALESAQTRYWALAASLHRHFAYVVTYLYNAEHHNHIHVDNSRSGSGRSVFDPGSITQVQAVQAITSYVWRRPLEVTGRFDSATRRATQDVLAGTGPASALTAGGGWEQFLDASAARLID
jgi:hypothetical protein